jgi:hypothetical protein
MKTADPGCFIYGRLVTFDSDGELAMAQLEHEASRDAGSDNINSIDDNNNESSGCDSGGGGVSSGGGGWVVCQVNVDKKSNNARTTCYLAFNYLGKGTD